jgi:NAD-reducing hydrogenase large subunit
MNLETALEPEKLKRLVIEPLTRVEGHGKVTLLVDDHNHIQQARLHIVEFRGFEKFIQGRPYWEAPVVVQRLCGICPVSHHLAAAKAVDQLVGVDKLSPTADNLRRLLHLGQVLQSHALHFFHLSSPDLLFGFDDKVAHRNIFGVIRDLPKLGLRGIRLRKYGQEIIRMISGKRVHGVAAIAGGMNKPLAQADQQTLLSQIDEIIDWTQQAVDLITQLYTKNLDYQNFATIQSPMLSLVAADGALELYDGPLRAIDARGQTLFDQVPDSAYGDYIQEAVKPWSYMKFPFLIAQGAANGWYRVGPLARLNTCRYITTPKAEAARQALRQQGFPLHSTLAYHWARMIEALYCAESIKVLLLDETTLGQDLIRHGRMRREGIGVVEAPRGTLIHHYQIDANGLIIKANLIVSTTHNNQAMNESIRQVAAHYLDGQPLNEGLLNQIEVAIRAYDPCLSCATHALGKMPLQVHIQNRAGQTLAALTQSSL